MVGVGVGVGRLYLVGVYNRDQRFFCPRLDPKSVVLIQRHVLWSCFPHWMDELVGAELSI